MFILVTTVDDKPRDNYYIFSNKHDLTDYVKFIAYSPNINRFDIYHGQLDFPHRFEGEKGYWKTPACLVGVSTWAKDNNQETYKEIEWLS